MKPLSRSLLLLMPAACVATAVCLAISGLLARGAANGVGYHSWTPTVGAWIFALPLVTAGVTGLRGVRARTREPFLVRKPHIFIGALGILLWIAIGWAYAVTVDNSSTYEGPFNPITGKFDPNLNEQSFFMLTAAMALVYPTGLSIAATKFLYLGAIGPALLDEVEGPDPMGAVMSELR